MGLGPAAQLVAAGVDAGRAGTAAAAYAAGVARDRGWDLVLAHSDRDAGPDDGDVVGRVLASLALGAGTRVHRIVTADAPVDALRRVSGLVSLLVLGQARPVLGDPLVAGRVATTVAAGARGPVVLVPWGWDPDGSAGRVVVVVLDVAAEVGPSLRCAFVEAELRGAPVVVVHGLAVPTASDEAEDGVTYADAVSAAHRRHPDVEARTVTVTGDPRRWVPDRAILASVVVAGPPRARSLAAPVLLRSGCPLLVAPSDDPPRATEPPHRRGAGARRR